MRHLLALIVLIILNLICYRRTVNGYFLADDFVHVAYLADVFNGHPLKLLENFTGNWMHAWGTQFYRPLISLTLAWDYLLGNGAAIFFHISNIIFHIASSIFLYLIAERMLWQYPWKTRLYTALAAAALFAVCPLHTEVVSWIIGRVDGVCLAFFLGAIYCFICSIQTRSKILSIAALIGFALSLLSKEMAVILPPLLVLTDLVLCRERNLKTRIASSLRNSMPFWIMLLAYICIRVTALGTLAGGYGGSIGEGLSGSLLRRFTSLSKLLFPFNAELIGPADRLYKQLSSFYKFAAAFVFVRMLFLRDISTQLKLLIYCAAWFLLALAPTYQVFNITDSLMCSRFAYFATAPFCLFIAFAIAPLWNPHTSFQKIAGRWLSWASALLLISLTCIWFNATVKNNNGWAHAGAQVREFRKAVEAVCRNLKTGENIALLNVPQDLEGAHMIYNGAMLNVLLSSPLSNPPVADSVISFEPPTYGDAEFINASRLSEVLAKQTGARAYYWNMSAKKLIPLDLRKEPLSLTYPLRPPQKIITDGKVLETTNFNSPALDLDPLSCDFIVVKLRFDVRKSHGNGAQTLPPRLLTLSWSSQNFPDYSAARSISLPVIEDGEAHEYVFAVSERKSWLAGQRIQRVKFQIPAGWTPTLLKENGADLGDTITIASGEKMIPLIVPQGLAEGKDSIFRLASDHFSVRCDARNIPACKRLRLELSKPNSWFEHYAGSFRDRQLSKNALQQYTADGSEAVFEFKRSQFPDSAYYELRCFALNDAGEPIGFCSDPINLQIN